MKNFTRLIFLVFPFISFCQTYANEESKIGTSINSFVPKGWKTIDSVKCDFNSDSLQDFSIVVEQKDPIFSKNKDCEGEEIHPKMLIIALKNKQGTYNLSLKTDKIFGTCKWGLQGGDAFSDIGNRKNTLKIEFFTGGTLRTIPTYYFKYKNGKWSLIGYTNTEIEVPSNNTYVEDYNLTKGLKESYSEVNGKKKNMKTSTFTVQPLIDLKDFDATGGGVEGITH